MENDQYALCRSEHNRSTQIQNKMTFTRASTVAVLLALAISPSCGAFSLLNSKSVKVSSSQAAPAIDNGRRNFLQGTPAAVALTILAPGIANAGIDPSALKNLKVEGDASGAETRLRQLETDKNRPEDLIDIPFVKSDSGVSFR